VADESCHAVGDGFPTSASEPGRPHERRLCHGLVGGQREQPRDQHERASGLHPVRVSRRLRYHGVPAAAQAYSIDDQGTAHRAMRYAAARSGIRSIALPWLVFATVGAGACTSSPVGVARIDPSEVHQSLTQSALSVKRLSTFSQSVLLEANLSDLYESDPEKALERLHDLAVSGSGGPPHLFAAAEASFLYAESAHKAAYYLAAAVYAWAYLFPEDPSE